MWMEECGLVGDTEARRGGAEKTRQSQERMVMGLGCRPRLAESRWSCHRQRLEGCRAAHKAAGEESRASPAASLSTVRDEWEPWSRVRMRGGEVGRGGGRKKRRPCSWLANARAEGDREGERERERERGKEERGREHISRLEMKRGEERKKERERGRKRRDVIRLGRLRPCARRRSPPPLRCASSPLSSSAQPPCECGSRLAVGGERVLSAAPAGCGAPVARPAG